LSFMTTDNNHDMGAARRIYPRYMIDRQWKRTESATRSWQSN
jgi:hypothetical protein